MNQAFPDQLYNGILLCLSIQLILVGIIKITTKEKRAILLGIFCFIVGTTFIYNLNWNFFKHNPFFSILLADYKNIFFSPILYLYVSLLKMKVDKKKMMQNHLILPIIIFLLYIVIKHLFHEFYQNNYEAIISAINIIKFMLISFYLIIGIKLFKKLNHILKPKIRRRYFIFYNSVLFYFWVFSLYHLVVLLLFKSIDENYFLKTSRYLFMPSSIIFDTGVLLFTILEFKKLKTYFIGNKIHINKDIIEGKLIIEKRIQLYFFEKKIYKNQNVNLKGASDMVGISDKILSEYIKNEYKTSFLAFINDLRVEEFKKILKNPVNKNYSLLGMAQEAGFKSKSTFYRVFKKREGITPNEYVKSM